MLYATGIGSLSALSAAPTKLETAAAMSPLQALATAGLGAERVAHGDFTEASGAAAMAHLLAEHPDLDAVLIASGGMAVCGTACGCPNIPSQTGHRRLWESPSLRRWGKQPSRAMGWNRSRSASTLLSARVR